MEDPLRLGAVGSALRLRFASLPTRIIVSVFAAAMVTGLAVTAISTHSTEALLRSKIDARFPDTLREAAADIERWYVQREIDLATFASSHTLIERLGGGSDATGEVQRYLAYVREGYPLYHSLFVLDASGALHVSVGDDPQLAPGPRKQLASVAETAVGDIVATPAGRFQLVSTPLMDGATRLGTLHAAMDVRALSALLGEEELDEESVLRIVDRASVVIASSDGSGLGSRFEGSLPERGAGPSIGDYTTRGGDHRVGGSLPLERLGWTLAIEEGYDVAFAPVVATTGKVLAINLGIVVAFGLLALAIARSITRSLRLLSDAAHRIAQGETDVEIPRVEGQDEIGVLARALHAMVERLRRNQEELQQNHEQIERANANLTRANEDLHRSNEVLEQLSFTDGLTQLHNHRYFQDRLRIEAKRCDRTGEPLALLLLDIDDFKKLNDRHGHAVGDEVLRRVALILNDEVRETDLPARYGGEEFAVLAPRTGEDGGRALGEKLRASVSGARFEGLDLSEGESLTVTVSVGASVYDGDVKRLFNEADRALYRAKGAGKDCLVLFADA